MKALVELLKNWEDVVCAELELRSGKWDSATYRKRSALAKGRGGRTGLNAIRKAKAQGRPVPKRYAALNRVLTRNQAGYKRRKK